MDRVERQSAVADATRALVEELLRTGFVFIDLISSLMEELPDDAFPGEDSGAVLLGMVAGSCLPAVQAAGERDCLAATALVGALRDRVLEDLRTAADVARPSP
jgi:hypothetical protein